MICGGLVFLIFVCIDKGNAYYNVFSRGNLTIPGWFKHKYNDEVDQDVDEVVRKYAMWEQSPKTFLLCPRGFSISRMESRFLPLKEEKVRNLTPKLKKYLDTKFIQDFINENQADILDLGNRTVKIPICPTLSKCLHYQGCVFNFGTEFCTQDPLPGTRKVILANLTCSRDSKDQLDKRRGFVIHIEYSSDLADYSHGSNKTDKAVEETKADFVFHERPEDFVFGAKCPRDPHNAGYRGNCNESDHGMLKDAGERLWPVLSRINGPECRNEVIQIYCALAFNQQGFCHPPQVLSESGSPYYNQRLFPKKGPRSSRKAGQSDPGVRLGFGIMLHDHLDSALNLLESIYKLNHFYVFHVDQRKEWLRNELEDLIKERFWKAGNVKVIPLDESSVPSWGSYGITLAQLTVYEHLLQFQDHWDFAIVLSGADLPVKSIWDIELNLEPFKGHNFFGFFKDRFENDPRWPEDSRAVKLYSQATWSCEGFLFNITSAGGLPDFRQIRIRGASQWNILSRDFVEHLLDQESHPEVWKKHHFRMATLGISDESMIPTFAMNSKFANVTVRKWTHNLATVKSGNAFNLPRHLDTSDFGGKGPSIFNLEDKGTKQKLDTTFINFFARKFNTSNINDLARKYVLAGISEPEMTKENLAFFHTIGTEHNRNMILARLKRLAFPIGPSEIESMTFIFNMICPDDPCNMLCNHGVRGVRNFDLILKLYHGHREHLATYSYGSQGLICHPGGHLRIMNVIQNQDDAGKPFFGEIPGPYTRIMSKIHIRMIFSIPIGDFDPDLGIGSKSGDPGKMRFPTLKFNSTNYQGQTPDLKRFSGSGIEYFAEITDEMGAKVVGQPGRVVFGKKNGGKTTKFFHASDGDHVVHEHVVSLVIANLWPGSYFARVWQLGRPNPHIYFHRFVVVGHQDLHPNYFDSLMNMWTLKQLRPAPEIFMSSLNAIPEKSRRGLTRDQSVNLTDQFVTTTKLWLVGLVAFLVTLATRSCLKGQKRSRSKAKAM